MFSVVLVGLAPRTLVDGQFPDRQPVWNPRVRAGAAGGGGADAGVTKATDQETESFA